MGSDRAKLGANERDAIMRAGVWGRACVCTSPLRWRYHHLGRMLRHNADETDPTGETLGVCDNLRVICCPERSGAVRRCVCTTIIPDVLTGLLGDRECLRVRLCRRLPYVCVCEGIPEGW